VIDAFTVLSKKLSHLQGYPVPEKIPSFFLSFPRQVSHTLFSIGTPLDTSKIDFRIGNVGSTGFAPSPYIVLKKLDILSTSRTGNIENIFWFPVPSILPRTLHDSRSP
jgi:hypothetical protein